VKAETEAYIQKAKASREKACAILAINVPDEAGRLAYLTAFHAAQALIYERTDREAKTHRGVRTQFALLTKDNAAVPDSVRQFLGQGYNLKTVADYGIDPSVIVPFDEAERSLTAADQFLACVMSLLTDEAT
jgi:uncharacterized protein (UPF0332 family)